MFQKRQGQTHHQRKQTRATYTGLEIVEDKMASPINLIHRQEEVYLKRKQSNSERIWHIKFWEEKWRKRKKSRKRIRIVSGDRMMTRLDRKRGNRKYVWERWNQQKTITCIYSQYKLYNIQVFGSPSLLHSHSLSRIVFYYELLFFIGQKH